MPKMLRVCDRCTRPYPTTARWYELHVLPSDGASQIYWLCAACWDCVRAVLVSR